MPEPTKAAIAVPAQDPKKKKPEEKPEEDVKDGAPKKDEEKEGEELVRPLCSTQRRASHTACDAVRRGFATEE